MDPYQQQPLSQQSLQWLSDVKSLFKEKLIQQYLVQQIQQILPHTHSVIVIYQKLFIKFHSKNKGDQANLYMFKISKSFPLDNSVRLYVLQGNYQPKVFDSRDMMQQVIGKVWNFTVTLRQIINEIPQFEERLSTRNENYLAMQKTGDLLLGDVFVYNQLQQHTSLTLFPDKTHPQTNLLNAVSQTHLLVFQRVVKKSYKSKQEEEYELKSKTLYGKKFMLSKFCELQCINSMQVTTTARQVTLGIVKYRSLRTVDDFDSSTKKITFSDQQSLRQFIRIVLKNLPKYQPTKLTFLPSYQKLSPQSKDDVSPQRILQLNQLQQRLQTRATSKSPTDPVKKQDLINRLNKSYQKMIEYYSARANPYYLIYVNKLNTLYQSFFVQGKKDTIKDSLDEGASKEDKDAVLGKAKITKSLSIH